MAPRTQIGCDIGTENVPNVESLYHQQRGSVKDWEDAVRICCLCFVCVTGCLGKHVEGVLVLMAFVIVVFIIIVIITASFIFIVLVWQGIRL